MQDLISVTMTCKSIYNVYKVFLFVCFVCLFRGCCFFFFLDFGLISILFFCKMVTSINTLCAFFTVCKRVVVVFLLGPTTVCLVESAYSHQDLLSLGLCSERTIMVDYHHLHGIPEFIHKTNDAGLVHYHSKMDNYLTHSSQAFSSPASDS